MNIEAQRDTLTGKDIVNLFQTISAPVEILQRAEALLSDAGEDDKEQLFHQFRRALVNAPSPLLDWLEAEAQAEQLDALTRLLHSLTH